MAKNWERLASIALIVMKITMNKKNACLALAMRLVY